MNQLDQSALNAHRNLLVMFVSLCVLDFLLVIPIQDRWAIGRILLTIIVMYFTLQGKKWAKWLLVSLCSLMVVALILVVVALSSQLNFVMIIGTLILALLNALIANYMIRSKELYQVRLNGHKTQTSFLPAAVQRAKMMFGFFNRI